MDSKLRLLIFQKILQSVLVEFVDHLRIFDNSKCMIAVPSASGSSILVLGEAPVVHAKTGSFDHVNTSDPITCATLPSVSSIRPSYRF